MADTRPDHDDQTQSSQSSEGAEESGGQVSEGPSGFGNAETASGGADAVPDTPDGVAESYAE